MHYDLSLRRRHYSALRKTIGEYAFRTAVYINDTDCLEVLDEQQQDRRLRQLFLFAYRDRGWYIIMNGPRYYKVGCSRSIVELCRNLLRYDSLVLRTNFNDSQFLADHDLTLVPLSVWNDEEFAAQHASWAKWGWHKLAEEQETRCWQWIDAEFKDENGELEFPPPAHVWNFGDLPFLCQVKAEESFTCLLLEGVKRCVNPGEQMFVLDWDHQCYSLLPHKVPARKPYRDYWAITPWPRYNVFFIETDGRLGFASQWNGFFTIFGDEFAKLMAPSISKWVNER